MKILILSNSCSGLYGFRKELIQKLIADGNDVYASLPYDEYAPHLEKTGCVFLETPVDRRGMNFGKDLKLLLQYDKMIRKIRPDVVLTYTIKPNIYGGIICRIHHTRYIENITGLGTAIENKGIISKILLKLYKAGLKKASQVFFQNLANKQFFETKKITKKSRLLPGSGVNLEEHCYEEYPKEDGIIRFLFVGRIMKDKGIGELLVCADRIGNRFSNVQFDLIGNYEEEVYREEIEALEKKGIVKFWGQQDDVHSHMKTHHAIILPSYHEGLSNVLLESAACGRPVLTTTVPGCRETFEEGVSGIGFEARNAESLIGAVEKFLALPYEEKRVMGLKGRQKVEGEFNRKIVVEAYEQEIYLNNQI